MCRGRPLRVARVDADTAWVEADDEVQCVSLLGVTDVRRGDYLYVHAGLALERLDPDEAQQVLEVLAEMDRLLEQQAL